MDTLTDVHTHGCAYGYTLQSCGCTYGYTDRPTYVWIDVLMDEQMYKHTNRHTDRHREVQIAHQHSHIPALSQCLRCNKSLFKAIFLHLRNLKKFWRTSRP